MEKKWYDVDKRIKSEEREKREMILRDDGIRERA